MGGWAYENPLEGASIRVSSHYWRMATESWLGPRIMGSRTMVNDEVPAYLAH